MTSKDRPLTPTDLAQAVGSCDLTNNELRSGPVGVAVSGGSDSTALLLACVEWAKSNGVAVHAVTVDHGQRVEAKQEAIAVSELTAELGVEHSILTLETLEAGANFQARARDARYAAMAQWAQARRLAVVAVGHTADDVAETFLMRLARGAGVDGLAQMVGSWTAHEMSWVRPLLGFKRQALRDFLTAQRIVWSDDPSNQSIKYTRTAAREVLAALAPLGIEPETLRHVAASLRDASDALDVQTAEAATAVFSQDAGGALTFETKAFHALPIDIQRRLFMAAIRWITTRAYAPRRDEQKQLLRASESAVTATLGGCLFTNAAGCSTISREPAATQGPVPVDAIWDGRWSVTGKYNGDLHIAALGEAGIAVCPDWRNTGLIRSTVLASPAIWYGDRLIAAPCAGWSNGWLARIVADFHSSSLSH